MAVTRIPIPDWARKREAEGQLDLSLAETDLPVRTVNCLEDEGILTIRQLLNCTPRRLLNITNFGEKTLEQVYEALERVGFFRPTRQPPVSGDLRIVPAEDHALLDEGDDFDWPDNRPR